MFLIFILIIVVVIVMVLLFKDEPDSQQDADNQEESEKAFEIAKTDALADLESKWGKCTKEICITKGKEFHLSDRIYVFEESQKIALDGIIYDFKDILGFSLLNNSKTAYNACSTGNSKKDLGSMVARGIAGKMIGGNMGAMIGAMSTPDEYEQDTEYHVKQENDYKIYINVNSIVSPTVCLEIGDCENGAYEIANLLNVILTRNNAK